MIKIELSAEHPEGGMMDVGTIRLAPGWSIVHNNVPSPEIPLSKGDFNALLWAVEAAKDWRGSLTNSEDPGPVIEFDAKVAHAESALKKIRKALRSAK